MGQGAVKQRAVAKVVANEGRDAGRIHSRRDERYFPSDVG